MIICPGKNETQTESLVAISTWHFVLGLLVGAGEIVEIPECMWSSRVAHSCIFHAKVLRMFSASLRAVRFACTLAPIVFIATFTVAADPVPASRSQLPLSASAEPPAYVPAYVRPIEPVKWKSKRVINRKFIGINALAMGLTIADIESTQHCLGNHTCRELNPLMPRSRAGMYAVNVPVNLGLMYLSYRLKASGRKTWWIAPLAISGSHAVGAGFIF